MLSRTAHGPLPGPRDFFARPYILFVFCSILLLRFHLCRGPTGSHRMNDN
jgi:hypothetical protein